MIENYSISQNKVGSLLVTLVLGMSIGDLQPKVTRDERFVGVDCVLHRTYDLTFEGDPNGYRVITMERDADKVIGIVCKTPCPHKHLGQSGNVAYVGSVSCGECKNYGGQTKEHVICNSK